MCCTCLTRLQAPGEHDPELEAAVDLMWGLGKLDCAAEAEGQNVGGCILYQTVHGIMRVASRTPHSSLCVVLSAKSCWLCRRQCC